jgi:hypothetical protein
VTKLSNPRTVSTVEITRWTVRVRCLDSDNSLTMRMIDHRVVITYDTGVLVVDLGNPLRDDQVETIQQDLIPQPPPCSSRVPLKRRPKTSGFCPGRNQRGL